MLFHSLHRTSAHICCDSTKSYVKDGFFWNAMLSTNCIEGSFFCFWHVLYIHLYVFVVYSVYVGEAHAERAMNKLMCRLRVMSYAIYCSACVFLSRVEVAPRKGSKKVEAVGIFPGTIVIRGPDWNWGNQDGKCTVIISRNLLNYFISVLCVY